jgi:DME family drug/metabolite transporter
MRRDVRTAVTGRAAGGAAVVGAAAALWGTDALFRRGLALELPSAEVVFWEHLLLAAIALFLVVPRISTLRGLSPRDWIVIAIIGGGSSVAATILFTEAFKRGDPTTPILLQKLQPVFAAGVAVVLLGERQRPRTCSIWRWHSRAATSSPSLTRGA